MAHPLAWVCDQFQLPAGKRTLEPYGNGHINDTYLLTIRTETATGRFILQRLNKYVFKRPEWVMENITMVTKHLAKKIKDLGGDPLRETLTLVPTMEGQSYYVDDEDGDYFRVYLFIEDTISLDLPDTPELFERSALCFGRFQKQLLDFPAEKLHECIEGFHNTAQRYAQLQLAIERDRAGRVKLAQEEIELALSYEFDVNVLIAAELPLRVTHNDTKLNNVLLDEKTGEGVCVIDLDTVMPGLAAYDFGDSIRFGANTASEDEEDLTKVKLDLSMYEAYVRGYLRAAGLALTPAEIRSLPMGAKLMTLECGLRFLADYFNGDVYFKVHKPDHNLHRARNQFALVQDMERKWSAMNQIVADHARDMELKIND